MDGTMAVKLYVGNLSFRTQSEELRDMFAQFGEVLSANVVTDRESGRSRGFGFVEMADQASAQAAQTALNGQDVGGRPLTVNEARPRAEGDRPRGPRSGGGGGRGGYGGGGGRGGDRSFGGGDWERA
jgi:RNA recognition motif-containing protein